MKNLIKPWLKCFPNVHTTLFWRSYDVVCTFVHRQNDLVCLLGLILCAKKSVINKNCILHLKANKHHITLFCCATTIFLSFGLLLKLLSEFDQHYQEYFYQSVITLKGTSLWLFQSIDKKNIAAILALELDLDSFSQRISVKNYKYSHVLGIRKLVHHDKFKKNYKLLITITCLREVVIK